MAIIIHFRLALPTPTTHFSTADNPTAKSNSIWTRFFTFAYLPVFNFKLLMYPSKLSFDWGMDAIPRITTLFDMRNVLSGIFYLILTRIIWSCVTILKREAPTVAQQRLSRTIKKKSQQLWLQQQQQYTIQSLHQPIVTYQSIECICTICKHATNIGHTSSCRAINNNNVPSSTAPPCGCLTTTTTTTTTVSLTQYINNNQFSSHNLNNINRMKISPSTSRDSSNSNSDCSTRPKQQQLNNSATILLSISILLLPFLPATNLFFYVGFVVAERILYLPSVGYCLLIGLGFNKLVATIDGGSSVNTPRKTRTTSTSVNNIRHHNNNQHHNNNNNNNSHSNNSNNNVLIQATTITKNHMKNIQKKRTKNKVMVMCICIILFVYSVKTFDRNFDWIDEESLYRSAIGINPPKGEYLIFYI